MFLRKLRSWVSGVKVVVILVGVNFLLGKEVMKVERRGSWDKRGREEVLELEWKWVILEVRRVERD